MKHFGFRNPQPLFQSRDISELKTALIDDDDAPDGGTFNRPTALKRTAVATTPSHPN